MMLLTRRETVLCDLLTLRLPVHLAPIKLDPTHFLALYIYLHSQQRELLLSLASPAAFVLSGASEVQHLSQNKSVITIGQPLTTFPF